MDIDYSTLALKDIPAKDFVNILYQKAEQLYDHIKVSNYVDTYKSHIGTFGILAIEELDNNMGISREEKEKRVLNIKRFLVDEFELVSNSKYSISHVLLNLQMQEYKVRKQIEELKNGKEISNGYTK